MVKRPIREAHYSPHLTYKVRMSGALPHFPHVPSWHEQERLHNLSKIRKKLIYELLKKRRARDGEAGSIPDGTTDVVFD